MSTFDPEVNFAPRFPKDYNPGIGIIGCGGIVKSAHLPAYNKNNLNVLGIYDISAEATAGVREKFGVKQVYGDLDEMLANPEIQIIDIATHPAQRIELIRRALEAGKHVLAQKPLALDLYEARDVVQEAAKRGLKLAVNQNGRWSPPWRIATLLIQSGAIGEVSAVTHSFEMRFDFIPGTVFDDINHYAIYDYSVHWIDITRCWLENKPIKCVRARDYRTPDQSPKAKANWGHWVETEYKDGSSGMLRGAACTYSGAPHVGHPFVIHGTEGTIRGNVLGSDDYVRIETKSGIFNYQLQGSWFPDGFAGTMGELMCSIAEDREPYNSARHNLLSLQITLTACVSADREGAAIPIQEV